jgi:hypothetical protein
MGGWGSGNRWRQQTKGILNASSRIDIRYLKRQGMLRGGYFNISWDFNGEPAGSVGIRVAVDDAMTVIYRWRTDSAEDWQPREQTVKFAHTACGFGGTRQWFLCPYCFRRVAVLVVEGAQVACRHCLHLTYASCNEDEISRSWRKREKIKARLGGNDNALYLKPKGMHQQTWHRLRQKYREAEYQGELWLESRVNALMASQFQYLG